MNKKETAMQGHRWAELRFSVVGGLLSCPPESGKLQEELNALASKLWIHPKTGKPVRFGFSTIEEWYYRAKRSKNPVDALRTTTRRDMGKQRSMSPELIAALKRQYELHPSWGYLLHYNNLAVVREKDSKKYGDMPSYSTLRRMMRSRGWTKKLRPRDPTPGQVKAFERLESREVRSYEASHVGGLGHLDFHNGSLKVVDALGEWHQPVCFAALDDCCRLCLHAQWYLVENAENLVHGFNQATLKRGLLRSLMSDNGGAMMSEEFQNGLKALSILHMPTLPYSPYQNAKQEHFCAVLEGQLMAMLENVDGLTLEQLNVYTQAWVEQGYNRHFHEELLCSPLERFQKGPDVFRPSPDMKTLRRAFCATTVRKQRRSDGTLTLNGVRFEVPNHLRTLDHVTLRYRSWDLSSALIVDTRTQVELAEIRPIDKQKNANGKRRVFEEISAASYPKHIDDSERVAPLLQKMLEDYAATGLPPAYIPKDEIILSGRTEIEKGLL